VTEVRPAGDGDAGLLLTLIGELAEYERLADEAVGTEEGLREHLFGARPVAEAAIAEAAIAEAGSEAGGAPEPVGFVLWYTTFSTFQCLPGVWVEDLFVRPEHRGGGTGRALLAHVAKVAVERGYGRLELSALDWNEPALGFYRSLGGQSKDEWKLQRFEGAALAQLAGG
jgi:GNAT superfamily N-acetyltransferase